MTTPEARSAAPIVYHNTRGHIPPWCDSLGFWAAIYGDGDSRTVHRDPRPDGQLWEREAERDVQAHGEPAAHESPNALTYRAASFDPEIRPYIAEQIERRRPAMRATRAELDALRYAGRCGACDGWGLVTTMNPFGSETTYECPDCKGTGDGARRPTRRLEPEPSSMARTGLALGLAFTSDDATA